MATDHEVKVITLAYLECALWASTDDDGEPLDARFSLADLGPEVTDPAREDVRAFLELLESEGVAWRGRVSMDQMGHDFWLTRNHHGAGFWDRGLGDLGDVLTKWAHTYGSADLYVTDDGTLDVTGKPETILAWIKVCDDCLVMHANDEVGERPEDEPQPWSKLPTADVAVACETDKDGDETCGFSWRDCDACGSTLGGTRHRMAVFAWEAFPMRGLPTEN